LSRISGPEAESFKSYKDALPYMGHLRNHFDPESPFDIGEPCLFPPGEYLDFKLGKIMEGDSMVAEVIKAMLRPGKNAGQRVSSLQRAPLQGDLRSINAKILTLMIRPDPANMILALGIHVSDVIKVKVPAAITNEMHYDSDLLEVADANLTPQYAGVDVHIGKIYVKMPSFFSLILTINRSLSTRV
jgi:hypothetical protein